MRPVERTQKIGLFFQCYIKNILISAIYGFRIFKRNSRTVIRSSRNSQHRRTGFDLELLDAVAARCAVPIIASGGAGKKEDFLELFRNHPAVDAGLAASIFHTKQVEINDLKRYLRENGVEMRV